jgi:hypothetical protein
MDGRLNGDRTHGLSVFEMASAGASFPPPSDNLSQEAASLVLLLNRAAEQKKSVIMAFSGHYDCLAVSEIWRAAKKPEADRAAHEKTFFAPYRDLIGHIQRMDMLDNSEKIRLLNVSKILQDINYALQHKDVQAAVDANQLKVVAYLEDPTQQPHALYIYKPALQRFVETDRRLAELSENPEYLDKYAISGVVDIAAFVEEKAAYILHERFEAAAHERFMIEQENVHAKTVVSARAN